MKEKSKKIILVLIGSLSLFLGAVGIILPVLPTTPFLLLAAFCYIRSSERLYNWLINQKHLGPYIHNYISYKIVPRKIKYSAVIILWISLLTSIFFIDLLYIKIILALVGITVSIHIFSLNEKHD